MEFDGGIKWRNSNFLLYCTMWQQFYPTYLQLLTLPVKTVIIWLVFGYASAQRSFASVYHIQKRAKRTRKKKINKSQYVNQFCIGYSRISEWWITKEIARYVSCRYYNYKHCSSDDIVSSIFYVAEKSKNITRITKKYKS